MYKLCTMWFSCELKHVVIFMLNRLIKPYPLSYGGNVLTPCIVLAAKVKLIKINLMIASLGITFMVLDLGVRWSL